jgi:hypothetical protein
VPLHVVGALALPLLWLLLLAPALSLLLPFHHWRLPIAL